MITLILIKTLINEISALNNSSKVTVEWIMPVSLTHTGGDSILYDSDNSAVQAGA